MRQHFLLGVALVALLVSGCADRQRRNPLDPDADSPLSLLAPLGALADNGQVRLQWDLTGLSDLDGVRIYRIGGPEGAETFDLLASESSYIDGDVTNGEIYQYRMSMLVKDEGEVSAGDARLATPGPEISWLADRGSGLVWRLSPDGRTGLFSQGRFLSIAAIGVDGATGDCWVSDRRFRSLHRIDSAGDIHRIAVDIEGGGDLAIDSASRLGWVVDRFGFEVYSFDLDAMADTLQLSEVDGTFEGEVELAVQSGALWIADPTGERVLLFDADGRRVSEWTQIAGLIEIDASANGSNAWVLAEDGIKLLQLTRGQVPLEISMPFPEPAVALDAGDVRGDVWVAGPTDIVAYTGSGVPLLHWDNVPGTEDVAIDEQNQHVWIAAATQLWKVSLQVSFQTQLTGFSETVQIVVDSGN